MRRASFIAAALGGILAVCSASDALAQSGSAGSRRSGWYVGGGVGANWASDINQTGFNRDPLCYPTDACFDEDPVPKFPDTAGAMTSTPPRAPCSSYRPASS